MSVDQPSDSGRIPGRSRKHRRPRFSDPTRVVRGPTPAPVVMKPSRHGIGTQPRQRVSERKQEKS